jgi:hypothetical protein
MNIDTSLEVEDNGSFHFTFTLEATVPGEGFGNLPIASADVNIEISSPSSGQLKIDLSGNVTFPEDMLSNLPPELATITPENINLMLQQFQGQYITDLLEGFSGMFGGEIELPLPLEIADLRLDNISCTEFSWNSPTLNAGFTATLSGSIFEEEKLRAELPATIDISFDGGENSISLLISGDSTNWEFNMTLDITATDGTWHIILSIEVDGVLPEFEEKGLKSLEIPPEFQNLLENQHLDEALENLENLSENLDISFELKVPEGTDVSGLPGGYDYSDGTYTWTGGNAVSALGSIVGLGEGPSGGLGEEEKGLPWLWIGVGILVVVVVIVAVAVVVKR